MSLSDATTPKDSSNDSISTSALSKSSIAHLDPLVFDSTTAIFDPAQPQPQPQPPQSPLQQPLSLHSKQPPPDVLPKMSQSGLPNFPSYEFDEAPLIVADGIDEEEEENMMESSETLALLLKSARRRDREPPPGAKRVMKTVRVRKDSSSSKRRTKKHALRVQLKESARIEEEMAEFRRKDRKKRTVPERRIVMETSLGSQRRPSGLRFSESCYSDREEEEDVEEEGDEGDETIGTLTKSTDVSMEWQQNNSHEQPDSEIPAGTMD